MGTPEQQPGLTEAFENLDEKVDELRAVHVHLGNLISVVDTMIEEEDMEEVRSILAAAHRYTEDLYDIAEAFETGLNEIRLQTVTKLAAV